MQRMFFRLAATAALLVLSPFVQAAVIAPGGSTSSTTSSGGDLGPNTVLGTLTAPLTTPTFDATVRQAVVKENSTGLLTFLYQISDAVNSSDALRRLTGSKFDGNTTDVFVATTNLPALFTPGTVDYNTADRSNEGGSTGNVVGFDFGVSSLTPGTTSHVYAVRVNATTFDQNGFISAIDETSAFVSAFQPTNVVPEPGCCAVLALGLFAGVARRTRRGR